jgi:Arc/MetJ-type ribon-helix-helix transcriptional regulator
MTNVSIPFPKEMLDYIDKQIKAGEYDNRSQFVRRSVKRMIEEKEIEEILEASRQAKMGYVFEGDLDKLAKKHG